MEPDEDVEGFSFKAAIDKERKKTLKGNGFERLGLSFEVLKGIKKKGYNVPTPIQRKTIPIVMSGRDVVAMARTGSGKTACFLIPMFERLKARALDLGARALILSPTRELAIQTLKFIRELGKFTGLKSVVILGGDSMDTQFSAIHGKPDIIVATPGRFLHLCVEMELKLNSVEYVVFDEADRLFEMGFGEQMNEILSRLPDNRQTVLFSATLPKLLVEFARAGLSDPMLLRLDVESKLPELLKLVFLNCVSNDKEAALIVLLKQIITNEQSAIFVATKHHCEYISMLLEKSGISNTCVYSCLDPSARKINVAKFARRKVQALIVTDVAARGIDLPNLDNVINFNFPAKAKLFIHRVGRCARAGRSGTAYSLVSTEELPYFLDLHLFLGKQVNIAKSTILVKKEKEEGAEDEKEDGIFGCLPQWLLEEEQANINNFLLMDSDMDKQKFITGRGYSRYLETRPGASAESIHRLKDYDFMNGVGPHPIFNKFRGDRLEDERASFLKSMKQYRPQNTVFEVGRLGNEAHFQIMVSKRSAHENNIVRHYKKMSDNLKNRPEVNENSELMLPGSSQDEIDDVFKTVIIGPKRRILDVKSQKIKKLRQIEKYKEKQKNKEHYVPYQSSDRYTEEGLSVNFVKDANSALLDLDGDTAETLRQKKQQMKWDRKKKKMVQVNSAKKPIMIRSESGQKIPATYQSGRYKKWAERNRVDQQPEDASEDEDGETENKLKPLISHPPTHWGKHNAKLERKKRDVALLPKEQILKKRMKVEREKARFKRSVAASRQKKQEKKKVARLRSSRHATRSKNHRKLVGNLLS